jgi:hypothetical protein
VLGLGQGGDFGQAVKGAVCDTGGQGEGHGVLLEGQR